MRKRLVFVAKLLISGALVAYAVSRVDLAAAVRLLPGIQWMPLVAMLVANIASRFLAAFRWYRLVRPFQNDVRYLAFVRLVFASSFYGQFLPGGGVETLQVIGLARSESSYSTALASVFADRAFGILITTLFLVFGLLITETAGGPNLVPYAMVVSFGLATVLFFLVSETARNRCIAILPASWQHALHSRIDRRLDYFEIFRHRPRLLAEALALAVSMNIVRISMFFFGAMALSAQVPFFVFFLAVPSILFLLVLPISVGGIGVRESILVFFFSLYGLSEEVALALGVLVYLGNILIAVPGAWTGLQAVRSRGRPEEVTTANGSLERSKKPLD